MKRSLQAIGIDMDNEDGRPGGLFVEMSESVKQQRGELDELIGTLHLPANVAATHYSPQSPLTTHHSPPSLNCEQRHLPRWRRTY